MKLVTRIAPSPTGMFHLGTARTAYFNWLAARASGGRFILRIDDTDAARNDDAYTDVIFDAMNWLGLDHDALYRQSARGDVYAYYVDRLLGADLAYRDGDAVRLRLIDLPDVWTDRIAGTVRVTDNDRKLIDGLVLMRSDGSPTYHFASMVDDIDMGVNLVIRGTDHINNTIKQIAIYRALNTVFVSKAHDIDFAHVGLIEFKDDAGKRRKLSKRDGAASLLGYRDAGYDPGALLNFMLRLGWSLSDANFDKKVKMISKDDAVRLFLTDGSMRNSPALMDPVFLDTLNRRYKAATPVAV